jgi:glycosyltransferase involved in cell wall biosynthesis
MADFPSLSSTEGPAGHGRPLRICIVTRHVAGPGNEDEIGTAYRDLAELLASAGHEVTVLCSLKKSPESRTMRGWYDHFGRLGIAFIPLPEPGVGYAGGEMNRITREPYFVYCWLKDQNPFDVVHVHDRWGTGYYCVLAKRLGLAFEETAFCIDCFGPTLWTNAGMSALFEHYADLGVSFMERRSVEFGDVAISGSRHLLRWMIDQGYDIGEKPCFVQPNVVTGLAPGDAGREVEGRRPVREIVFLGRLEPGQGLQIFCDAVQRLGPSERHPDRIVFLGQTVEEFPAESYISTASRSWPFAVHIETGLTWPETLDFLATEDRLAVIAPLYENCSHAIRDCLSRAIPFICSDVGGNPELINPRGRETVMFAAHPASLGRLLREVLRDGAVVSGAAIDDNESNRAWLQWHAALARNGAPEQAGGAPDRPLGKAGEGSDPAPLVSVCMAHYERPELVEQALESVRRQTYENFEVVLVDDGSTSETAKRRLEELEPEFEAKGWRIVRQENRYLGAVRNTGARHARGEYLLFMDDDNIAKPNELEVFVKVAQASGADILTCVADGFRGENPPDDAMEVRRIVPLGPALAFSFFANGFGDSNCFVKRASFEKIGGFTEDYKVGLDDQEFFARSVLTGFKLEVVPEPLFWYRLMPRERSMKSLHYNPNASRLRLLRPYLESAPPAYRNVLRFAKATFEENKKLREELLLRQTVSEKLRAAAAKRVKKIKKLVKTIKHRLRQEPS